ncbi:MAG: hypothetical protein CL920_06695 [Deltaproteobacteria bacterium]|nr:hypothetical protein [Deltaproteobacteria bacterium]MBU48370.1 hypothetical protein [Deltaproteobacteria bacterium]
MKAPKQKRSRLHDATSFFFWCGFGMGLCLRFQHDTHTHCLCPIVTLSLKVKRWSYLMSEEASLYLSKLMSLWEQERKTTHERFVEERQQKTLEERVESGLAIRDLSLIETDAAPGDRTLLWVLPMREDALEEVRVGVGAPVRLWWDAPDSAEAVIGTVSRKKLGKLGIMIDGWPPERLETGSFHLDLDEPQTTFERGKAALQRFMKAETSSDIGRLREVLFGERTAQWQKESTPSAIDVALNAPQRAAVSHAMCALDVALIHGPPGTGKTRTLVEVIRQAVQRGERVLATAASNTAVDNLAERLVQAGIRVVRLGHPARVSEAIEAQTLDALLEETEVYKMTRKWIIDANALRRKIDQKQARQSLSRSERRELVGEMRRLFRDARKQREGTMQSILEQADVVCSTATGADSRLLGDMHFDLVVLDEATQATDPIALVPFSRGRRIVMAGDPCQLPPTVIDLQAERQGLGQTLFERLAKTSSLMQMLEIQYRMHKDIMAFPSQSMYEGRLQAAVDNATHRLEELEGVQVDPLRDRACLLIDTAGKGWEEVRKEDDPSTSNPGQAERVAAECRRLLGRGVAPSELVVITPYAAQVRLLRTMLVEEIQAGLEIGSVDGFQGREKEAVVVDLVRSNDGGELGFLQDVRRMNVALTRAKRFLLVIGDSATLGGHPYYEAFFEHCEQAGDWMSAWDDDAPPFEM